MSRAKHHIMAEVNQGVSPVQRENSKGYGFDPTAELEAHDPDHDGPIHGGLKTMKMNSGFDPNQPNTPHVLISVTDEALPKTVVGRILRSVKKYTGKAPAMWLFFGFLTLSIIYVLIGATFFYYHKPEWSFVFSLYVAVQMIAVVGYGDVQENPPKPSSNLGIGGMWFASIYAMSGILLLTVGVRFLIHLIATAKAENNRTKQLSKIEKYTKREIRQLKSRRNAFGFRFNPIRDTLLFFLMMSVGIVFGIANNDFTFTESVYWVAMTATTIGFGDLHAYNSAGYIFDIFYMPLIVVSFTMWCISVTQGADPGRGRINKILKHKNLNTTMLEQLQKSAGNVDGDAVITEAEWLSMVVISLGFIDEDSIALLRVHFNALDKDGDGHLSVADIIKSTPKDDETETQASI